MAPPMQGCCMPVARDRTCCDNVMQSRYLTDLEWRVCHAVNIYVFRNGVPGENPILIHIPPEDKRSMRRTLKLIDERVGWKIGFSKRLYRMDGRRVKSPCHLEMYFNYVVASNFNDKFKCVNYGRIRSPLIYLHQDSTHIRHLRQKNPYYDCWLLKKKATLDERPQFIFPVYYTADGLVPPDLPVGQLGNYRPCTEDACTVPISHRCGLNKYLKKRCTPAPPCKMPCPGAYVDPHHFRPDQFVCKPMRGDNSLIPQDPPVQEEPARGVSSGGIGEEMTYPGQSGQLKTESGVIKSKSSGERKVSLGSGGIGASGGASGLTSSYTSGSGSGSGSGLASGSGGDRLGSSSGVPSGGSSSGGAFRTGSSSQGAGGIDLARGRSSQLEKKSFN